MKPKFETVGQIKKGNTLFTYADTPIVKVAEDLAHSRWTGMPVVDRENRVIGMVSEQDLLRAFREPRHLDEIKVKEIMTKPPIVIKEKTSLEEASKIMEDAHIHRLPVVKDGVLIGTVTRHDLLRAWLGMSIEEGANY
jgi:CBS domain-containing protein